ncbi:MAG: hypothetical protein IKS76_01610 [Paludibacteraceae bacterium]|nr:hypothetical protein [Paludibacteraceae bacterium]
MSDVFNSPLATQQDLEALTNAVNATILLLRDGLPYKVTEDRAEYSAFSTNVENYVEEWYDRLHAALGDFEGG